MKQTGRLRYLLPSRSWGFSFAEVMVLVIMVGFCFVPILGTLDSNLARSQSLGLKTAAQNLAESKMNSALHDAMYLGVTPGAEYYLVSYPTATDSIATFAVSVDIIKPVTIAGADGDLTFEGAQTGRILQVSVEVGEYADSPSISSASLMTLVTPPSPPPDNVYVAIPSANKIVMVNPITHLVLRSFNIPEAPLHLAVHPTGRWLAIKCAAKVYLMGLVPGAAGFGICTSVYAPAATTLCGSTLADTTAGALNTLEDRGLVFRPDGKYLYLSVHSPTKIHVLTVPASLPGSNWTKSAEFSLNSAACNDMKLLENGWLVTGQNAAANQRHVFLNTFQDPMPTADPPRFLPIWGSAIQYWVAGSWDGQYLYSRYNSNALVETSLVSLASQAHVTIGGDFVLADGETPDGIVTPDNMWLVSGSTSAGNSVHMTALRRPLSDLAGTAGAYNDNCTTNNTYGFSRFALSPFRKELLTKSENSQIHFTNWAGLAAGGYRNADPPVLDLSSYGAPSDVTGRIAEWAWVGVSDGASTHRVECFDVFGGVGSGTFDERKVVAISAKPTAIGLTAGGDRGAICTNPMANIPPHMLDCFDNIISSFTPAAITYCNDGNATKAVYLRDRTMVVINHHPSCSCPAETFPDEDSDVNKMHNGFALYPSDSLGNLLPAPTLGYHILGSTGWRVMDVVPMHRSDGAYVLMTNQAALGAKLFWIEKSKEAGYTGTDGTDAYKIMGVWQQAFDGFPQGLPVRMALSRDDTLLALYDVSGNGTKQAVRIYDLANQRFPPQIGLTMASYNSNTGDFTALPASAAMNIRKNMTKHMNFSRTASNLASYPLSLYNDNDATFSDGKTMRFFGNWNSGFNGSQVNGFGLIEEWGSRFAIDGILQATSNFKSGASFNTWADDTGIVRHSFVIAPAIGNRHFQFETWDDASWDGGSLLGRSSVAPTSAPTGSTINSVYPVPTGGGGTWEAFNAREFRAQQFAPALLHTYLLDGTGNLPDLLSGGADDLLLTFNRDTAMPVLFLLRKSTSILYHLKLFAPTVALENNPSVSLPSAGIGITAGTTTYVGMDVSPDGRRLLIAANNPHCMLTFDISPPMTTIPNPVKIPTSTGLAPTCLAVRPFNSVCSNPDEYAAPTLISSLGSLCGNQRAAVGSGGIYLVGGSDGQAGTASNGTELFNPLTRSKRVLAQLPATFRHHAVVPYNNRLFMLGGNDGTNDQPRVGALDLSNLGLGWDYSSFIPLSNNDNSGLAVSSHAGCQTPYGMVAMGGGGSVSTYHYDYSITNFTQPTEPKLTPVSPAILGTQMSLGTVGQDSAVWTSKPFPITGRTSFKSYFIAEMRDQDGMTFCVHNDSGGISAMGGGNAGLGFTGITPSVAIWIDNHKNGSEPSTDFVDVYANGAGNGVALSAYGYAWPSNTGPLGELDSPESNANGVAHFWVEYDGDTNILNAWCNTTNSRGGAVQVITNYPWDMSTLGNQAYFGFTGALNGDATAYNRISRWDLQIWEATGIIWDRADFSSDGPIRHTNSSGISSNWLRVCTSSDDFRGSAWLANPVYIDNTTDFSTYFIRNCTAGGGGDTFCVQGSGDLAIGGSWFGSGYLAYPSNSHAAIPTGVAIEMDAFGGSSNSDESEDDHFALQVNGTDAALSHSGNVDIFNSATDKHVWIDYSASTRQFSVYLATSATKPGTPTWTSSALPNPLPTYLGGNRGWFGFTGSNGNITSSDHNFKRWTLTIPLGSSSTVRNNVEVYYPQALMSAAGATTLPSTLSANTTGPDSSAGSIIVLAQNFPSGTTINSWSYKYSGGANWTSGSRSMCPVMLDPSGPNWVIRDIGNTVTHAYAAGLQTVTNQVITWANGGVTGPSTVLGWWNGSGGTGNGGLICWTTDSGPFTADFSPSPPLTTGGTVINGTSTGRTYNVQFSGNSATSYGETFAMTSLPEAVMGNAAVCHYSRKDKKFYLYSIGGGSSPSTQSNYLINRYDFSAGTWSQIDLSGASKDIYSGNANAAGAPNRRTQVAACAWGDEIFIFSGAYNGAVTNAAIAYCPDTGRFRDIKDVPGGTPNTLRSAVPCGPFIYLFGGADSEDGTGDAVNEIYRYCPSP